MDVGDFRPISLLNGVYMISLLNGVYMIVEKCLVECLKSLLCGLFGSHQWPFIRDRQILVGFLVAHECIEAWTRQGVPGLVWKLGLEKAYDSVNWHCLDVVMACMGFGDKWREWIGYCESVTALALRSFQS